jgi:hypothetical protein
MKIGLEKLMLVIFFAGLIIPLFLFVTPVSDNYLHYTIARQILRDPSFLWRTDLSAGTSFLVSTEAPIFNYPPLLHLIYAFLFLIQLTPRILDILSIIIIGYLLYRMEKKSIPFLFLSFMFIRIAVFGGIDIFITALVLLSIYFFDKKPEISGVFAGLTILVKGTAFMFFFIWLVSIIIFKRKEIFSKKIFKSKFFIAIILSIIVASGWYIRNFVLFNGDIMATLVGFSLSDVTRIEGWLQSGVQAAQPEREWFDTTGYYPLPIDILFYLGIAFTIFNIAKSRKLEKEHLFILFYVSVYAIVQLVQFNYLMTIRYYLPIFPLLAIQIARGIPEKYIKFAYIGCLAFLIFFILSLPQYTFNQIDAQMGPVCRDLGMAIDSEPVYVNAFHNWYVTYRCDLNATTMEDSKWTLDFDQGQLYLTNMTNATGA